MKTTPTVRPSTTIFALQHIDHKEYVTIRLSGGPRHLVCFTTESMARNYRRRAGLTEFCDIWTGTVEQSPFHHFCLDHELVVSG